MMAGSRLVVASLLLFAAAPALHAGDEDMSPSAYQVFDPETGFMVPVSELESGRHPPLREGAHGTRETATGDRAGVAAPLGVLALAAAVWLLWRRRTARGG